MKVEVRGTSPYWLSRNGGVETMAMPQRRFAYAKATEDRHDRGNQATAGGEEETIRLRQGYGGQAR